MHLWTERFTVDLEGVTIKILWIFCPSKWWLYDQLASHKNQILSPKSFPWCTKYLYPSV